MPSTIADVAQEKGALLQRRGVEWNYSVTDNDWTFSDTAGALKTCLAACPATECGDGAVAIAPAG